MVLLLHALGVFLLNDSPPCAPDKSRFFEPVGHRAPQLQRCVARWVVSMGGATGARLSLVRDVKPPWLRRALEAAEIMLSNGTFVLPGGMRLTPELAVGRFSALQCAEALLAGTAERIRRVAAWCRGCDCPLRERMCSCLAFCAARNRVLHRRPQQLNPVLALLDPNTALVQEAEDELTAAGAPRVDAAALLVSPPLPEYADVIDDASAMSQVASMLLAGWKEEGSAARTTALTRFIAAASNLFGVAWKETALPSTGGAYSRKRSRTMREVIASSERTSQATLMLAPPRTGAAMLQHLLHRVGSGAAAAGAVATVGAGAGVGNASSLSSDYGMRPSRGFAGTVSSQCFPAAAGLAALGASPSYSAAAGLAALGASPSYSAAAGLTALGTSPSYSAAPGLAANGASRTQRLPPMQLDAALQATAMALRDAAVGAAVGDVDVAFPVHLREDRWRFPTQSWMLVPLWLEAADLAAGSHYRRDVPTVKRLYIAWRQLSLPQYPANKPPPPTWDLFLAAAIAAVSTLPLSLQPPPIGPGGYIDPGPQVSFYNAIGIASGAAIEIFSGHIDAVVRGGLVPAPWGELPGPDPEPPATAAPATAVPLTGTSDGISHGGPDMEGAMRASELAALAAAAADAEARSCAAAGYAWAPEGGASSPLSPLLAAVVRAYVCVRDAEQLLRQDRSSDLEKLTAARELCNNAQVEAKRLGY